LFVVKWDFAGVEPCLRTIGLVLWFDDMILGFIALHDPAVSGDKEVGLFLCPAEVIICLADDFIWGTESGSPCNVVVATEKDGISVLPENIIRYVVEDEFKEVRSANPVGNVLNCAQHPGRVPAGIKF